MTIYNEKPFGKLDFPSFENLRVVSRLDATVKEKLQKMDLQRILVKLDVSLKEGNRNYNLKMYERAYIHYTRALEIFEHVQPKLTPKFKSSQEGSDLYGKASRMLNDFSEVTERVQRLYTEHTAARLQNVDGRNSEAGECPQTDDDEQIFMYKYIHPKELIDLIERGQRNLLLDYRSNKEEKVTYRGAKKSYLVVVQIEPTQILPGCLLKNLIKTLSISERHCLETIDTYDRVVLLPDTHEAEKSPNQLPMISKTLLIFQALTTYNMSYKLKVPPMVLEGGIKKWSFFYPCHVTREGGDISGFKDEDAEFEQLLQNAQKAVKAVQYPDLDPKIQKIAHKEIEKITVKGDDDDSIQRRFAALNNFIARPTVFNHPFRSQTGMVADEPHIPDCIPEQTKAPIPTPRNVPCIDRSKKPSSSTFYSKLPPKPSSYNDENTIPISDADKKRLRNSAISQTLPKVPTLGAARLADAAVGPSTNASSVVEQTVPPLTPNQERPSILQPSPIKTIQPGHPTLFYRAYESAHENFRIGSRESNTKRGCTGFYNIGNTCFMNSTLQALLHTPKFISLFLNKETAKHINLNNKLGTKGAISGCFSALADLYWSGKYSIIQPRIFLEIFARYVNESLADRKQHDAQEFQIYLLDALHEDTNRISNRKPFEQNYNEHHLAESAQDYLKLSTQFSSSPVNDIFNLITISTLRCETCNATSARFEELTQISIELPSSECSSSTTLTKCLDNHFNDSLLDEPWDCPNCKRKRNSSRSTRIWSLPEVLIIHMRRGVVLNSGTFTKNEMFIEFDHSQLNMCYHMHNKALKQSSVYQLYAITNHYGSLNSGHYTSFVRDNSEHQWLLFDDERCSIKSESALVTKNACMLYYRRR